jgi:hypothetical protein
MKRKLPPIVRFSETELHTWFERDRAHVELRHEPTQKTIIEWWDEAVAEAFEDGFLKWTHPRYRRGEEALHRRAFEYAVYLGIIREHVYGQFGNQ